MFEEAEQYATNLTRYRAARDVYMYIENSTLPQVYPTCTPLKFLQGTSVYNNKQLWHKGKQRTAQ